MKTTITLSLTLKARQDLENLAKASDTFMSAVVESLIEKAILETAEVSNDLKDRECGNELVSDS